MGAFYRAAVPEFLTHPDNQIIGFLSSSYQHNELQKRQIKAWEKQILLLKTTLSSVLNEKREAQNWTLLLEYPIPRRQKRLDAVLLAGPLIFCLEFKTEDKVHSLAAQRQVEEYALDLRDFHRASNNRLLLPITIAPKATSVRSSASSLALEKVQPVRCANATDLADVLLSAFSIAYDAGSPAIDAEAWDNSEYRPVPTIIEAAEALYAGHNVREIVHSHAGTTNLTTTSECLISAIKWAQQHVRKLICFVTGVPGAGKTLAGLNVVHNPALRSAGAPAGVLLSGNGPLVKIVSAAIAREHKRRVGSRGGERTVTTFIQNVHVFVREYLEKSKKAPVEHVVIFDEAQRAWNADQNRKKNGIEASEPETLLSIMDRHHDWAVVVALVGGGQEIHNGEAGLTEWGKTLREKFAHWRIVVSPKALEADAANARHKLFENEGPGDLEIKTEPSLHLNVSLRSFRAQKVIEWVDALLECKPEQAAAIIAEIRQFPIACTRSLKRAKEWLRAHTRGERRCGLLASSGAIRLRAEGLELSSGFRQGNRDMYVHWFLNAPPDVRSSNQLEIPASEFECQGLELDWCGVCWGGDLLFDPVTSEWMFRNFSGSRWGKVNTEIDRKYLLNTYRVLMTRARRGLVIWIPNGDPGDATREPGLFDATAGYVQSCGLKLLEEESNS